LNDVYLWEIVFIRVLHHLFFINIYPYIIWKKIVLCKHLRLRYKCNGCLVIIPLAMTWLQNTENLKILCQIKYFKYIIWKVSVLVWWYGNLFHYPSIYCRSDHASQYDTRETFWDTQLERLIWNLFNILSVLQLVIFFSLEVTFQCSCLQDILYDLTFHHHLTFTNLTTLCLD